MRLIFKWIDGKGAFYIRI